MYQRSKRTVQREQLEQKFKEKNQKILIVLREDLSLHAMKNNIIKNHDAKKIGDNSNYFQLKNGNSVLFAKYDYLLDYKKCMEMLAGMEFTYTYGDEQLPMPNISFIKSCIRWVVR